ncbi:MAG: heterodisulfide reductase-related iron-sulfur binding cluster [Anaerolineae bacterium]
MTPFRPTYYNVPHWAEVTLYVTTVVMLVILAYGIWRRFALWQQGQPAQLPEAWSERFGRLLTFGPPGQRRVGERLYPGSFHAGILWGFIILFIGTALATIDYDIGVLIFDVKVLQGPFYLLYEVVLDIFGVLFIAGLLVAMYRRYVERPEHISARWGWSLWSLLFINVSGFLLEGYRLALQQPAWARWSPVGYATGQILASLGLVGDIGRPMHLAIWLIHVFAALGFLALIPFNNVIHLVTSSINVFYSPLRRQTPAGAALAPINIEDAEFFGVGEIGEFTWKQRLGFDACTRCGRCSTVCPANMAGTALDPKQVIVNLDNHMKVSLNGNGQGELPALHGGVIGADELWACTTCMACVRACPVFIEIVDDIVDLRRYLTLSEGAVPTTAGQTMRQMMQAGNPWGYPAADRHNWAEGLDVPQIKEGEHVEYLYWVGCSGAYDSRNQKIARAVARVLKAAGISFAVMSEEKCNGESARRLGDEYLYQQLVEENVGNLNRYSFNKIITHCPHCFNTLKNEYPQFGGEYEVVHHSQVIEELIQSGRVKLTEAETRRITFHDSCYIGRYNGVFDAPRALINAQQDLHLVEMERIRDNGLCCGGGGGQMWMEVDAQRPVNLIRLEEAMHTNSDVIGTTCPFCLTMLDDAVKTEGVEEQVVVKDVAELVAEVLQDTGN